MPEVPWVASGVRGQSAAFGQEKKGLERPFSLGFSPARLSAYSLPVGRADLRVRRYGPRFLWSTDNQCTGAILMVRFTRFDGEDEAVAIAS